MLPAFASSASLRAHLRCIAPWTALLALGAVTVTRAEPPAASGGTDLPACKTGDTAPPFFVRPVNVPADGPQVFDLHAYVGDSPTIPRKAVLISFFATWCHPCMKEMPFLVGLAAKYGAQGLQVVSVSIDKEPDDIAKLPGIIQEKSIVHPVLADQYNLVVRRYLGSAAKLPSVVMIKADGTIASLRQGYEGDVAASVEAEVRQLLGLAPQESGGKSRGQKHN